MENPPTTENRPIRNAGKLPKRVVRSIMLKAETLLLDNRLCDVSSAAELDAEIRAIFALDSVQRGDEICGTLYVDYSDESVKQASLLPSLQSRGIEIVWRKKLS